MTLAESKRIKINFKSAASVLLTVLLLAGCSHISIEKKPGDKNAPADTKGGQAPAAAAPQPLNLTGDWQFGFQFENDTLQSSVHLEQSGVNFSGSGKDDKTGMEFTIEQGVITGGTQVEFYKKYASTNAPEIQYTGTLEQATDPTYKGPYMHGDYTTAKNGKVISNIWEAELSQPGNAAGSPAPEQASPIPGMPAAPAPADSGLLSRTPELSGKWNCGYEYNFKTIHSTMFLEQEGDRILGHGVDHETKEKFVIDKGWYHYPKLTLVRKWGASKAQVANKKGKGKHTESRPERTMTFKATVSNVSDKDYSGPYLSGKTQGGGSWEAQLYK